MSMKRRGLDDIMIEAINGRIEELEEQALTLTIALATLMHRTKVSVLECDREEYVNDVLRYGDRMLRCHTIDADTFTIELSNASPAD